MDIKKIAEHLNVTVRTASNWREGGAPIHDVGEMVEWLKTQRRHTKISTKDIMIRRDSIEAQCKALLLAYVNLTETLIAPLQSDWEIFIAASLNSVDPVMEKLVMTLKPELAIDSKDRKYAEKLRAEAWPVTGE